MAAGILMVLIGLALLLRLFFGDLAGKLTRGLVR